MAAVVTAPFFAVTLASAQSGTINTNMIGEQPVGPAELEVPYAKIAFRVEAGTGQTSTSEEAPQAQKVAATAVAVDQQLHNDDRVQALAQELTEARRTIEGLEAQLRAEAAKSALLVEEERREIGDPCEGCRGRATGTDHSHGETSSGACRRTRGSRLAACRRRSETSSRAQRGTRTSL